MSTDLTLFTHPVFGNLRTIVDGETQLAAVTYKIVRRL